jgi:hypothetical protein
VRLDLWIEAELQEDLLHVSFHCPLSDEESGGDCSVREPLRNQPQHFALAMGADAKSAAAEMSAMR